MKKILVILAGFMISCTSQATNTESNTETGVESDQIQMKKSQNKVIKKSIEKTGNATLITEYDQQGNIIKIRDSYYYTENYYPDGYPTVEFTLRDGKILSAKTSGSGFYNVGVNKQENSAYYSDGGCDIEVKFNEFGYKEEVYECQDGGETINHEYNKDGLLVKRIYEAGGEWMTSIKTTTTYTYDVMSQDWTKRTGTDNEGNKTVTTRTVEYW